MSMFCYQCEQTAQGKGCTVRGVCGKVPEVAGLLDLLLYAAKDISRYAHRARQLGAADRAVDLFVLEALFTTVTNVNFDPPAIQKKIQAGAKIKAKAVALYAQAAAKAGKTPEKLSCPVSWWENADDLDGLLAQAARIGVPTRLDKLGPDVTGLQELITYGLKGAAAYADHAQVLGVADDAVYAGFHELLDYLTTAPADAAELTARALKVGELNLKVMELLDRANTAAYGQPEPTKVRVTPVQGKCIAVSGHDLKDLAMLLEQTAGKGINVYTHGEMLPCHGYPALKKHKHLVGNYGGAWQDQQKEFDAFPGAILMTTNCIQKPREGYQGRIFTTGLVAFPDVTHIPAGANGKKDFTPVIEAALAAPGFPADEPEQSITVGFGHNAVMSVAGAVIDA
ncbi:MAG TPA: hydroxylamine reductase, partial [Phycisphaerae bacterium]|nr:hydroxylamine reductase [Phycisphaerae bacterium]